MITELKQRTALQFRFQAGPTLPATPSHDGMLFCLTSKFTKIESAVPIRFVKEVPQYSALTDGPYVLLGDGTPNITFHSAQWGITIELHIVSCVTLSTGNVKTPAELYISRQGEWVKLV